MAKTLDPQVVQTDGFAAFWSALERLFNIGPFYPAGHVRCVEVSSAALAELVALAGGAPTLTVDAGRDALAVQGHLAALDARGAARLHGMMAALGIARLEIDTAATPLDLHAFAILLLRAKHQADTATGLREVAFADLPPTTRIHQREFGRRVDSGSGLLLRADQLQAAVTSALQSLDGRTLDDATREAFRGLVEKLFSRVAERLEMTSPAAGGDRAPFTRSLEDALMLGVHAVQHAVTKLLPDNDDVGDVKQLFACTEQAIALADDRQSVELMFDVLRQANREDEAEAQQTSGAAASDDEARYQIPLPELVRRLTANAGRPLSPQEMAPADHAEPLSILLQFLLAAPPPATFAAATRALTHAVSEPPRPGERTVCAGAVRQLLAGGDAAAFDRIVPHVFGALRRLAPASPAELLRETGTVGVDARPAALLAAWPHVVNELLLGAEGAAPELVEELRRLAAALPEDEMRRQFGRLERLDALREGLPPKRPGLLLGPDLAVLCGLLLASPRGDRLGARFLETLQAAPPPWPGAAALPLLSPHHPPHRLFLARLLHEGPRGKPSQTLLAAAGRILVEELPSLAPSSRREPWVPKAIRALGELPAEGARPLLVRIVRTRRLVVLHAWPAACRDAAGEALRRLAAKAASAAAAATAAAAPPAEEARP